MTNEIVGFVMLGITFVITFTICCIYEYFRYKQCVKWNNYINEAKTKLEDTGFIFSHSYQLVNKKDNSKIRFLRIFKLNYNLNTKKVDAYCYMTNKNGEIGTWSGDYKYLLDIHNRWHLTDNGEWNPND